MNRRFDGRTRTGAICVPIISATTIRRREKTGTASAFGAGTPKNSTQTAVVCTKATAPPSSQFLNRFIFPCLGPCARLLLTTWSKRQVDKHISDMLLRTKLGNGLAGRRSAVSEEGIEIAEADPRPGGVSKGQRYGAPSGVPRDVAGHWQV